MTEHSGVKPSHEAPGPVAEKPKFADAHLDAVESAIGFLHRRMDRLDDACRSDDCGRMDAALESDLQRAREEGRSAAKVSKPRYHNPYSTSDLRDAWFDGYDRA